MGADGAYKVGRHRLGISSRGQNTTLKIRIVACRSRKGHPGWEKWERTGCRAKVIARC